MRRSLVTLFLLAVVPLAGLSAQSVRRESRELRHAERALRGDVIDRRQAARAGDATGVRRESREIRHGRRDVRQESRDVRRAVRARRRS